MANPEFMTAVLSLKKVHGKEFAILASSAAEGTVEIGAHQDPIPNGDETAMVAILHRQPGDLNGKDLYVTYPPTEMCLGLAWRAKVDNIYVVSPTNYIVYSVGDADCLGDGWRNRRVEGAVPVGSDSTACSRFLYDLGKKNPRFASARSNLLTGRPEDPLIKQKLNYGLNYTGFSPHVSGQTVDQDFMRIVYAMVRLGWNDKPAPDQRKDASGLRPFGNNIAGIIVDQFNRIIAWGLNFKHVNPSFHAETMMVQYWLRRNKCSKLPPRSRVYTSLECCYMCAGYIATVGEGVEVIYGQKDPNIAGPNALARCKNQCRQRATSLSYVEVLREAQGSTGIIDFLFDKSSKNVFGSVSADIPSLAKDPSRTNWSIILDGNKFLQELQDVGVLHHTTTPPLGVQARSPRSE
jgi:tRNA(Arg) A34 adenosine deaminase TadA